MHGLCCLSASIGNLFKYENILFIVYITAALGCDILRHQTFAYLPERTADGWLVNYREGSVTDVMLLTSQHSDEFSWAG